LPPDGMTDAHSPSEIFVGLASSLENVVPDV
jgi:hypothetical protein